MITTTAGPGLLAIPCLFMRGGTSRGAYFLADDLAVDEFERDALLLAAYGSPDHRQIDGIGGADPLTSKAAIVAKSERPDIDVEYTFCQVGIDEPLVSKGGNCGNMLAGVGPFAILRGLVAPEEPRTSVRIFNTNTAQTIIAHVPVDGGAPAVTGDCAIPGVPGTGARICLEFENCAGSVSGVLLPTGNVRDLVSIDGDNVPVSLVDAATPFVFVAAKHVGAAGTESPEDIAANQALLERLEQIRAWAAVVLGLVSTADEAKKLSPNVPRVMMVAPPMSYTASDATLITASDVDFCVRQLAMQRPHRALSVTGSICCAVAASLEGSVVHECRAEERAEVQARSFRVGHPSGIADVVAGFREASDGAREVYGGLDRTARLLMSGHVYVRRNALRALSQVETTR